MQGIGEFFKRIQGAIGKEIAVRNMIREAIKKRTGADIDIGSIKLKNGIVELSGVSQSLRSAIFIKKQAILGDIDSAQSAIRVSDIR
ncbi:MAG: hypothetical protein KGI45_03355 [Patescibacteria group bacterium]|nr:hypothetical protein [Patescibacteria group bacterium]MDE1940891.1 hypothetical protein [Patescibacteria group bacterium]MDE1967079.1 hypothetical protein [Patescibacteria group bacterium]